MPVTPDRRDELKRIALSLDETGHGARRQLAESHASALGISAATLYRQLEKYAGWTSGRKTRSDKGGTRQSAEGLDMVSAIKKAGVRRNGKETIHTEVAAAIAAENGIDISVSPQQLNRLLRARRLDGATQAEAAPAVGMRSLHPNHLHQVDPSLCLVYYDKGRQVVIQDDELYKNKLSKAAQLRNKVWRYVLVDHTSGTIIPYYISAKGESQKGLFEFLMFAWSKQPGRPFYGVPQLLMMDPGSANTAHSIRNLLRSLQCELLVNKPRNARAKGSVENAQNIVETQFESRLRFRPATSVEEMNEAAFAWANAYNANLIPNQDTRLSREGMVPQARYDLWLRIRANELRALPDRSLCLNLLLGAKAERKVSQRLEVTYRHPQSERSMQYDLSGLAGIVAGDVIEVWPMVYGRSLITVRRERYDGEMLEYQLEPVNDYNEYGHRMSWPVVGEEFHAHKDTEADAARKRLDRMTFGPDLSAEEIQKAKDRGAQPFAHHNDGKGIDSLDYLKSIQVPTYIERKGTPIDVPRARTESDGAIEVRRSLYAEGHSPNVPSRLQVDETPLGSVEAAMRLRERMGDAWNPEMFERLAELYPQGVMEDELELAMDRLLGHEVEVPRHLRAVK